MLHTNAVLECRARMPSQDAVFRLPFVNMDKPHLTIHVKDSTDLTQIVLDVDYKL